MTIKIARYSLPSKVELPNHLHPVLRRVFAARGICSEVELDYSLQRLLPYQQLSGIEGAVDLLVEALNSRWRIMVVADFDADGATSCALAVRGLRLLGAKDVCYIVPNRFEYGYGLTPEIVAVAGQRQPDLLITVDNGISSIDGVAEARRLGMRVLITDHHLPGQQLPDADATVNPNLPDDPFPSKHLAGVGVMFYVLIALRARLRDGGAFREAPEPNLADLLDLVALGTVADVVPLDANNRSLVAQGMSRIRAGRCRQGIKALCRVAGRNLSRLGTADLGYALAPRLNAAGRLTDMSLGIECLLTDDAQAATRMASQLDQLNVERRRIESEMHEQALATLARLELEDQADMPLGLCLFNEEWHPGVIGILASRIKQRVHRPVIAFAADGNGVLKGSARSVAGVHIRDVLEAVAGGNPGLIDKFGGHAMAAGLSLEQSEFDRFQSAFDAQVRRHLSPDQVHGIVHSDGELNVADFNMELAETLRFAAPWGQGFPEPIFDGKFELLKRRVVGAKHLKMLLSPAGSELTVDAIAFNTLDNDWPEGNPSLELAYRLDVNEYKGNRRLQLIVESVRLLADPIDSLIQQ